MAHLIQWENNKAIASLTLGHQVHAQLDQNTRPAHRIRNGNIYYANPEPGQKGLDEMPHPPMEADGSVAFNCFLPGQYVKGNVVRALKARYTGKVFEIRTASGSTSLVTANHPIFTEHGFTFASQLKEGQNLWSHKVDQKSFGSADKKDGPALIEDIFVSLQPLACAEHATALDFYGDGKFIQGDVRVVGTDLKVPSVRDFQEGEQRRKLFLRIVQQWNHGRMRPAWPFELCSSWTT